MWVRVSGSPGEPPTAVLHDPSEFTRLHVELAGVGPDAASATLSAAGLGYLANGFAWLNVDVLRDAVASMVPASDNDATARFDSMVDYARGHDWLSADGRFLRAHCERKA